jgi:hypothetical protein
MYGPASRSACSRLSAPRDAADQAAAGETVEHGQLFGEAQRVMDRQQVPVDEDLHAGEPLRRRGGHDVRRRHEAVGRRVMLVEPDPVEPELLHQRPRVQVLAVGPHGQLGTEVSLRERIGKLTIHLHMVQVLGVRE